MWAGAWSPGPLLIYCLLPTFYCLLSPDYFLPVGGYGTPSCSRYVLYFVGSK